MSPTFGSLLKQLRKRVGMTQDDLAAAIGYSRPLIGALERNDRLPDLDVVIQTYLPALGLQDEPLLAAHLVELAAIARGERPPPSLTLTRERRLVITKQEEEVAHRLPAPPTTLLGRDQEINHLCNRLLGHHGRLLTLVGPPGVGKTRLAQAVGAALQRFYKDGACFVPLAAVSDPALVASTLVTALKVQDGSSKPAQIRLIEHLRRKELLLILDNFEQLISPPLSGEGQGVGLVAELLAECAGLRILVTSRERLHLRAEQRYRVPPLALAAAVDLFVQRAMVVDADFVLTPANRPTIEAICQRLDRLPLALELCAAQIDLLSPPQLLARLQDRRLELLVDGAHDLPPRQRTLRTAIGYSYALLTEAESTLLRSLGVFVGGFDLGALEAVVHGRLEIGDWRINDSSSLQSPVSNLRSLIGKSLVQAETTPAGEQRFLLLETIREFALAQMSSEERTATQQRHTTYFVAQAVPSLDVLVRDHANFHAALVSAIATHDTHAALTLCLKLDRFWQTYGYWQEGLSLTRAALAMPDKGDARLRLDALESVSTLAWQRHHLDVALEFAEEATTLARSHGPEELALALNLLGRIFIEQGDYGRAEVVLRECTQVASQVPHLYNPGSPLAQLGEVALARGDWDAAQTHLAQAVTYLASEQGLFVDVSVAMAHTHLAEIALAQANPAQARHELRQALPHARLAIRRFRCVLVTLAGLLLTTVHTTPTEDAQAAAAFLSAEAALGEQTVAPSLLLYQPLIAQRSESAQRLLTQPEWQTAWQVGHTWTLAQAVAEAEKWLGMSTEVEG